MTYEPYFTILSHCNGQQENMTGMEPILIEAMMTLFWLCAFSVAGIIFLVLLLLAFLQVKQNRKLDGGQ